MKLKIVADENILEVKRVFHHLGSVTCLPGREITSDDLKNADVLLIRSVTKVTEELLHNTPVKMVCSATIGTDHIEHDYLEKRNIAFAHAPGSNANSVAEYVMAAILEMTIRYHWHVNELTLGVVGVGNIGSIVVRMAEGLGMRVLQNDPPLARQTGDPRYIPLSELMDADIITCHVPLNRTGHDKTFHLFDKERLQQMRRDSVLMNTSRGAVVDNDALKKLLMNKHLKTAVLDVWEHEPVIDTELLNQIFIGTPHIAGYSLDGKMNGTYQIYRAVCDHFNISAQWNHPNDLLPEPDVKTVNIKEVNSNREQLLAGIVRKNYDIWRDDANLRKIVGLSEIDRSKIFQQLRKDYPIRREFHNTTVTTPQETEHLANDLQALGFKVETDKS